MSSTQPENNTNNNTEWIPIDDETVITADPNQNIYRDTEIIEDDGIIYRSQPPSGQSVASLSLSLIWHVAQHLHAMIFADRF